jgi:excisionase family DNA binding protein
MDNPHAFLTPQQLADLIGVHREVVYRWQANGNGPPFHRISRARILYDRRDVDEWLASRRFADRAHEAAAQRS